MAEKLDLYHIVGVIGRGSYATVHKAIRKSDNVVVALKVISLLEISQDNPTEQSVKEVTILQTLHHVNVIACFDTFEIDMKLVLILEFADAGDLKRFIIKLFRKNKRLSERVIWKYVSQICEGVKYMHSMRIMHRDLKPANIFLSLNGTVKIGDLGLGRMFSEDSMTAYSKVGTPLYVSPEVLKARGYGYESDIWSIGCILYELCELRSPFKDPNGNILLTFEKIQSVCYAPLSTIYSDNLKNVVSSILQLDPHKRPSITALCELSKDLLSYWEERKHNSESKGIENELKLKSSAGEVKQSQSNNSPLNQNLSDNKHNPIDDIELSKLCFEKLEQLNYENDFCHKYNFPLLKQEHFIGQFDGTVSDTNLSRLMPVIYFTLCHWLLSIIDVRYDITSDIKRNSKQLLTILPSLGLAPQIANTLPPNTLIQGYGRPNIAVLNWILEKVKKTISTRR